MRILENRREVGNTHSDAPVRWNSSLERRCRHLKPHPEAVGMPCITKPLNASLAYDATQVF